MEPKAKIYRNWMQNYDLVLRFKSDAKIYRNWTQNYDLVLRGLSQITFALGVGRWSEKRIVYYIKSAN